MQFALTSFIEVVSLFKFFNRRPSEHVFVLHRLLLKLLGVNQFYLYNFLYKIIGVWLMRKLELSRSIASDIGSPTISVSR